MVRLVQDFLGHNGKFHKKCADEVLKSSLEDSIIIDRIVRWKSNNLVPPADILELLYHTENINGETYAYSEVERQNELERITPEGQTILTEEAKLSMDANFEPGTKIMDLTTSKVIYTTKGRQL